MGNRLALLLLLPNLVRHSVSNRRGPYIRSSDSRTAPRRSASVGWSANLTSEVTGAVAVYLSCTDAAFKEALVLVLFDRARPRSSSSRLGRGCVPVRCGRSSIGRYPVDGSGHVSALCTLRAGSAIDSNGGGGRGRGLAHLAKLRRRSWAVRYSSIATSCTSSCKISRVNIAASSSK